MLCTVGRHPLSLTCCTPQTQVQPIPRYYHTIPSSSTNSRRTCNAHASECVTKKICIVSTVDSTPANGCWYASNPTSSTHWIDVQTKSWACIFLAHTRSFVASASSRTNSNYQSQLAPTPSSMYSSSDHSKGHSKVIHLFLQ